MTIDSSQDLPQTIPYATPSSKPGSATAAAAVIAAVGIALAVLGGCFLIGVLVCVTGPGGSSGSRAFLVSVLYILAFGCFAGAGWLLFIAVVRLIKITRS